jgi:hypothetical protein
MPSFGEEVKESVPCPIFAACRRTWYLRELRCASKIPCMVPSSAGRGLSCLCGLWRLWWWMRGTHWGQGYNRPTGCSAEKAPHATFFPLSAQLNPYTCGNLKAGCNSRPNRSGKYREADRGGSGSGTGRYCVVVGLSVGQGEDLEMAKPISGDRSCWGLGHCAA